MNFTRRAALKLLAYGAGAAATRQLLGQSQLDITPGPFTGTRSSLQRYRIPAWFGECKFGIWSHWGPQSAVGDGDWYARNMYVQGSDQNKYHVEHFGPPSKVGYKDLIHLYTADRWDPDHLMDLYVKAGAKYFFSMGVHHDNFDLWNSRYQPRWNAVAMGPRKDVVALWAQAARRHNLPFGVSEHLSNSFDWYAPAHPRDSTGPLAGVPYDGSNPLFADLYHNYAGMPADFVRTAEPMGRVAPTRWKLEYFRRVKDLIDQHHPDLLYTDGGISFEEYGLSTVAEMYNVSAARHGGVAESIYFSKTLSDCALGTCTIDRERGISDAIEPEPWQTDTCIGQWHYKYGQQYKSAKKVMDMLVDIVSKNGNLLLNFPLPASGELDPEEMKVLEGITAWMTTNGEGIHRSRPWKIYGEGPAMQVKAGGGMNEDKEADLGPEDMRFTTNGATLYVFVQGWPAGESVVRSLGTASAQQPGKVEGVEMLGYTEPLRFTQEPAGLRVKLPASKPASISDIGFALKVNFA
jgi:alpha-L-fucosidase